MAEGLGYSRPLATAARLSELATDRHRFTEKRVVLTGESAVLATANGRMCLLDSLRLLVRICRNVRVVLPETASSLARHVSELAGAVAYGAPVSVGMGTVPADEADAVLSVGTIVPAGLPWTTINANGWLARVSSGDLALPADCALTNPIAALAAACLGSAEVFKRLVAVHPSRGPLLNGLEWSLFSYRVGNGDPGPSLPGELPLPTTLLVGNGAIGNGATHLFRQLPFRGRVSVVDRQGFGEENLGTCILIGPAQVGVAKAAFAAEWLGASLGAVGYSEDLATFARRLGAKLPFPDVVLGAVDDAGTRREIQDLWPDLVIDGAIGDFGAQVSRHEWGTDLACLSCLFEDPPGEPAEVQASRATGLRPERIAAAGASGIVTDEDIEAAPAESREFLRARAGRPICSVVSEELTRKISAEAPLPRFAPSVPFVACLSAAMVVAELVKWVTGYATPLETRFQLDALTGPAYGDMFPQERRQTCICRLRPGAIERLRAARRSRAASDGA
jgi:hypothetical protein